MPRNIDLVRYRRYGDDLLLLEQFASSAADPPGPKPTKRIASEVSSPSGDSGVEEEQTGTGQFSGSGGRPMIWDRLEQSGPEVQNWYETPRAHAMSLGDGVYEHAIDRCVAFRGLKNFAYVRFRPSKNKISVELNLSNATRNAALDFVQQTTRPPWRRIDIDNVEDVQRVLSLIAESYLRT